MKKYDQADKKPGSLSPVTDEENDNERFKFGKTHPDTKPDVLLPSRG